MFISSVTDEVSPDRSPSSIPHVFGKLARYDVRHAEIRMVENKRYPAVDPAAWDRLKASADEHDITFTSVSPGLFKCPLDSDLLPVHRSGLLQASLTLAERIGVSTLVVFGVQRSEADVPEDIERVVDLLGSVADAAAERGFRVQLENIPGSWADTSDNCLTLLEGVGRRNFGYIWDTGNLYESEAEHFLAGYRKLKPYVENVHLKDGRFIDGEMTWQRFGEGVTDIRGQVEALLRDDYRGSVTVEAKCEPHEEEDFDVSIQYLQSLLGRASAGQEEAGRPARV